MPTFQYTIRDNAGQVRTGTAEADNQQVLSRRLQEQGFQIQAITRAKAVRRPGQGGITFGGVRLRDLSVACRQFSTMVDAGVSLVRCLTVLQEQSPSTKLRRVLADVQAQVESGQSLSTAMARHPRIFNNLFIGLIRAGEVGGVLEESLQRLSQFLEKDVELRRKVRSAMTYPIIVMVVAVSIVIGLVTFIVPKFIALFKELGVKDFPKLTQYLMSFSNFLTMNFPQRQLTVAACVIAGVIAFRMFVRTKFGKRLYDRLKLKVPVFGRLNHRICLARFSRTLGTLLVSGVPILQALETVAGTVDNEIISDAVMQARARIREGDRIGEPLQKSRMFPPMVVQMISIGEESGALDQMLTKVAEFYESEVDAAIEGLTAAIEPVMIVMLGGCVLFIALAVLMPMVNIIQSLQSPGGGEATGGE